MATDSDSSGAITHPPILYLLFLLLSLGLDWLWPAPFLPRQVQYVAGGLLFAAGLIAAVPAARLFFRAGTGLPTNRPTTALVTAGPYRYSRNPIYLGLTLAYLGVAAAIDGLWAIGMVAAIPPVLHYGVVRREERYLERKFGDAYRRYCAAVRRWL